MANVISEVGHGLKVAVVAVGHGAADVAKGVAAAVKFLVKAEKVLEIAIKDQPKVRAAVVELVKRAHVVIADVEHVAGEGGLNLKDDAQALKDAEAFFAYFKDEFIPLVEQIYGEVQAASKQYA
jgi:hypothetical protein